MNKKIVFLLFVLLFINGCIDNTQKSDTIVGNIDIKHFTETQGVRNVYNELSNNHYNISIIKKFRFNSIESDKVMKVRCETNSMYPVILCNNTLLLREVNNFNELRVNDIVMFDNRIEGRKQQYDYVVHRIIKLNKEGKQILTIGDNNKVEDRRYIDFEKVKHVIIGVVWT